MSERTLRNGGHVASLPSPERIEVIVHLNGRQVAPTGMALEVWDVMTWKKPDVTEPVDRGGLRLANDSISVTVYP